MRSRLRTNLKKQNTKAILGIIIIFLILGIFGNQLLVGFASFVGMFKGQKDNTTKTQSVDYISPPLINTLPPATKDEKITITGVSTAENVTIYLYINSELTDKVKPDDNNQYAFKGVSLRRGENEIKSKAIAIDKKESEYSEKVIIKYLDKPPSLEINSPQDGQTVKKDQSPIKVSGKTDQGVKVTVNDFWAISNDDGTFYYMHNLKDGENNLKIVATDEAGNKTEKELKIKVE